MSISKKKQDKKRKSEAFIKEQRKRMLEDSGYAKLKAKHGSSKRPDIPSYKVESRYSLSNSIGNGLKVQTGGSHPDAKQFPVGNDHKSGLRLIVATDDLKYMAGKKT